MPGDTTQKPGPGAHSPEQVCTGSFWSLCELDFGSSFPGITSSRCYGLVCDL